MVRIDCATTGAGEIGPTDAVTSTHNASLAFVCKIFTYIVNYQTTDLVHQYPKLTSRRICQSTKIIYDNGVNTVIKRTQVATETEALLCYHNTPSSHTVSKYNSYNTHDFIQRTYHRNHDIVSLTVPSLCCPLFPSPALM